MLVVHLKFWGGAGVWGVCALGVCQVMRVVVCAVVALCMHVCACMCVCACVHAEIIPTISCYLAFHCFAFYPYQPLTHSCRLTPLPCSANVKSAAKQYNEMLQILKTWCMSNGHIRLWTDVFKEGLRVPFQVIANF